MSTLSRAQNWILKAQNALNDSTISEDPFHTPLVSNKRNLTQSHLESSLLEESSPLESFPASPFSTPVVNRIASRTSNRQSLSSQRPSTESAQRNAARFLSMVPVKTIPGSHLPVVPFFSSSCLSYGTSILLRSFRGTYLRKCPSSLDAISGGNAFDAEHCELVFEKLRKNEASLLRFDDHVFLRLKNGNNGLYLSSHMRFSRERSVWILRSVAKTVGDHSISANSSVVLECPETGLFLGTTGLPLDGDGSRSLGLESSREMWHMVPYLGQYTCFVPPIKLHSSFPRQSSSATNDERVQFLDGFLGVGEVQDLMRPLCDQVAFLRSFSSNREDGRIRAALVIYVHTRVMEPFDEFLSTLYVDMANHSLTMLMNLIQSKVRLLSDWARLIKGPLYGTRGGSLLNALAAAQSCAFEFPNSDVLLFCLEPYIQMLTLWMTKGQVQDPFYEFFIQEDVTLHRQHLGADVHSRYWKNKFTLIKDASAIPFFLQQQQQDMVLRTGRIYHILHLEAAATTKLSWNPLEIRIANEHANRLFMQVLAQAQLFPVLLCCKRFFLMEQGDFFSNFMLTAQEELTSPADSLSSRSRLQTLLPVLLREQKQLEQVPVFLDSLTCVLLNETVKMYVERIQSTMTTSVMNPYAFDVEEEEEEEVLQCVDVFALEFHPPWPLSLVFTKRALAKYQLLFRHLFQCKHAEQVVAMKWRTHSRSCQRALHFLQSYSYYVAFEVLEPRWRAFFSSAQEATDVDALETLQEDFLDSCLRECLLTNPVLLGRFFNLLQLCLRLDNTHSYIDRFDHELTQFLNTLSQEAKRGEYRADHLPNLAIRLDFSQFYAAARG